VSGRLDGKIAVVTGASSGIGRAVARRFVAEGADVFGLDRAPGAAVEGSIAIAADISQEDSVAAAFERVTREAGRVDVVVANAGIQLFGGDAPLAELDLDIWRRTIDVNLTGTFLTLKYAIRAMAGRGGSVIVTGSPTGLTGIGRGFSAYSASKAGVHGLVRVAAADYAGAGIRVNTVVPGFTATPLVSSISDDPHGLSELVQRVPLGRPGEVADVEGIMVYLASDESAYATGSLFVVDGGLSAL
jgi:NAD(P)-dependent dehydrogenase (short-subunit alcohol dehydrogenase family)